jgi:hypothetical protein
MTRLRKAARLAGMVLGTGYCLFFFSETMFWSLWRPDENPLVRAGGVLFYSFLGYILMALIALYRVRDIWTLMVAGACFGWVGEGVFAMTVFGAGGIPLPFTIAWTALAWHMPISVVVGWWWLGRALRAPRAWGALWISAALGLFWGAWGYGWRFETPPVVAEPGVFLLNAAVATGFLAVAHWAIAAGNPAAFRPSRIGLAIAAAVTLAFFGILTVPQIPFAPLVLAPLLAIVWLALRRAARSTPDDAPGILADLAHPVRLRNAALLGVMPVVATAVYAGLGGLQPEVQTHIVFALLTSVAGIALFAASMWKIVRRSAQLPGGRT